MKKLESNGEDVKRIYRYSEGLKRKVVSEIESGKMSVKEVMTFYGITHRRTVTGWVRKLGNNTRPTQIVRVIMKSEQERIQELEKALADAHLENFVMKNMIAVIEEDYGEDIKKNFSTEQLKKLEELKKKAGIA